MLKIRKLLFSVSLLFLTMGSQAADMANSTRAVVSGYLGMGVDNVPTAVRAHYPESVGDTKGVIVTRFADKSPAADYGIKLHDVLISYDGKAVNEPSSLIKAIRDDKPGREAKIKLIRQGEVLELGVVIGEQAQVAARKQVPPPPMPYQYPYRAPATGVFPPANMPRSMPAPQNTMPAAPMHRPPMPQGQQQGQMAGNTPPGADFKGLAIRKIGEDIYDASIGFTAPDGSTQRRSYKGTREQIIQQVMNARDLPPAERQQLLFAVKPKKKKSSGWGGMPFGDSDMFNPGKFFKGWGW